MFDLYTKRTRSNNLFSELNRALYHFGQKFSIKKSPTDLTKSIYVVTTVLFSSLSSQSVEGIESCGSHNIK